MRVIVVIMFPILLVLTNINRATSLDHGGHPLSKINMKKAQVVLHRGTYVGVFPPVLGLRGHNSEWITLVYSTPTPSDADWIGVFSPGNISTNACTRANVNASSPHLCSAPIKYQYANYTNAHYASTGRGTLQLQLINQRSDFSFALFSGGLSKPKLMALSKTIKFSNPKAPTFPRLSQGKEWNSMVVRWTSGYGIGDAEPFVEWHANEGSPLRSLAGTLTFDQHTMCGEPARTIGWRDPGFIHTSFMTDLWPNTQYRYRLGHRLNSGDYVWSRHYNFKSPPYPGQNSLQRIVIFGNMGKFEADSSNEYNNYQPGSQNTTQQLTKDLDNIDMVFHIGGISYANGYISQWDQFTAQIEPIASTIPYMIASGNNERDWPGTGSFFGNSDSGGECGVLAENMFYVPAENPAKFWYSADYGMFRFCVANTEHDWREGTEQYKFLEHCFASVNRQTQPWLVFLAHRVLGYSSGSFYAEEGSFGEPMGRDHMQTLLQRYKVDIAIYGHVHNYERTCPIYENTCTTKEKHHHHHYRGNLRGTIHVVAGGGGAVLSKFSRYKEPRWSVFKDYDYGFVKLTAMSRAELLFEYKKSSDGNVHDSFRVSREYRDILACNVDSCPSRSLAT